MLVERGWSIIGGRLGHQRRAVAGGDISVPLGGYLADRTGRP